MIPWNLSIQNITIAAWKLCSINWITSKNYLPIFKLNLQMNILGHARVYTGPRVIRRPSSGVAVGKDNVQLPSFYDEKLYIVHSSILVLLHLTSSTSGFISIEFNLYWTTSLKYICTSFVQNNVVCLHW